MGDFSSSAGSSAGGGMIRFYNKEVDVCRKEKS